MSTVIHSDNSSSQGGSGSPPAKANGELTLIENAVGRLRQTLQSLPDGSRQALLLHRIGGLKEEEIAIRLGVSVRTIERDISDGLMHMRRALFHK